MIHSHCDQPLEVLTDDSAATRWQCCRCGRIFSQRKRQPGLKMGIMELPGQIYCEIHTDIHADNDDPFGYNDPFPECNSSQWRPIYIKGFPGEEF